MMYQLSKPMRMGRGTHNGPTRERKKYINEVGGGPASIGKANGKKPKPCKMSKGIPLLIDSEKEKRGRSKKDQ